MTSTFWGCCTNDSDKENKPLINCIRCNKSYHFICLSIAEIPKDSEAYRDWKCAGCSSMSLLPTSAKKNSTPVRNVSTTRGNKRPALNSPPETATAITSEEVRSIVQEVIKAEFATMIQQINSSIVSIVNGELAPIRKDVEELKASLSFHTSEFDKFQSEHVELKNTARELKDENLKLQNTVADLSQRLNYLEQQTRANNLELQCVPENKNENLYTIVKQLGSVVDCEIKDSDISHCTRIAKLNTSNTRPRSIVVQLASPRIRDQLLASVIDYNKNKTHEKLNTADFGMAGNKSPVFVAEHLSPAYKALHAATRLKAKEKGYKYVWVRNGRIFVRKSDGDEHIFIKSIDILSKLK
uniref:FP protein C-terminal domain-containing protein n=1 Tax=Heliothis virescens TaxID=7102 RepID=A0A2A4IXU4_HELVI